MPTISEKDLGNLTAHVTITIAHSEYEPAVTKELKEYQKKAAFKGFRPGKTPMSFVRKMYGQQVMANKMNNLLQDKMIEFLEEKDVLGQPIPVDQIEGFDLKSNKDYDFVFEIGYEPKFEVVFPSDSFTKEIIKIDDKYLQRELQGIRQRAGEVNEDAEIVSSANDVLKVKLQELDGEEVKEGGVESETYLSVDLFASEALKEQVLGLGQGATFNANYKELSKEFTGDRIKRYLLKLEADKDGVYPEFNEQFKVEILSIRQVQLAEMNEEFFDKVLGEGSVTNEEEFLGEYGQRIERYLQNEADTRLFLTIQKQIMEVNKIEFPEAFLKKWLLFREEEKTEEEVDAEMPNFLDSYKWMLIKKNLQSTFELNVSQERLRTMIKNQFRQYFQGQSNEDMLNMLAEQVLNGTDEKTEEMRHKAYQEALDDVVFEKLASELSVVEIELTTSEFDDVLTKEYELKQAEEAAEAAANVEAILAADNSDEVEVEVEEIQE